MTVACITFYSQIGKELEADGFKAEAPTAHAHSFKVVVAEMFGLKASNGGFGKGCKEVAERGIDLGIGADIGANGGSNGVLVDGDEFIELRKAGEGGAINGGLV